MAEIFSNQDVGVDDLNADGLSSLFVAASKGQVAAVKLCLTSV